MPRSPRDTPDPDEYVTLPTITQQIPIGQRKLRAEIHAGRLIAVDLATPGSQRPRYAVRRRDLEAWLAARTIVPQPPDPPARRRRRSPAGITQYV